MKQGAKGPSDLEYLIDKLEDWYAEVTGEDLKKRDELKADEFLAAEKKIRDLVQSARKIQKDRNTEANSEKNSTAKILKMTQKLKEMFSEIEDLINSMGKIIERHQKKLGEEQSKRRLKIQANYRRILENLREQEKDVAQDTKKAKPKRKALNDSLDLDVRAEDIEAGLKEELDDDEANALERWKETDKKIDNLLDGVITTLDQVEKGLVDMGEKIENNAQVRHKLEGDVDKINKKFDTSNQKLKKLLVQFRSPHKFCMDIALILILLVMLGLLYKVITK